MELIIGDKAFSTWSLRPWLILKRCGATFSETRVALHGEGWREALADISPSGKVPLLKVDGELIWDSLAIAEWANDRFPEAGLWPDDGPARWLARSVVAEFHAGFSALRTVCGMGPDHSMVGPDRCSPPEDEGLCAELRRLVGVVRDMRVRFGGHEAWLFGRWSVADAFLTPVATRVRHFQIDLTQSGDDGTVQAYFDALLKQPDFLEWAEAGLKELAAR